MGTRGTGTIVHAAPCALLEALADDSLLLHCAQQLVAATDLLQPAPRTLTCRTRCGVWGEAEYYSRGGVQLYM